MSSDPGASTTPEMHVSRYKLLQHCLFGPAATCWEHKNRKPRYGTSNAAAGK